MKAIHPTIQLRLDVLRVMREVKGLDADDKVLANAMGISASSVSRVLSGKQQPGPRFQAALCLALEVSMNDLFVVIGPGEQLDRAA